MTRTIGGRTDHVVVVGAGLAGLSAALHLAGRGRAVTVVERGDVPGGRVGRLDIDGYRLDTGPTVLTMPDLIDETFAAVGESTADRLELETVDPAYRALFSDGSALDVHSDRDAMAAEVERLAGPQEAQGYLRLRDWLARLYEVEFDGFIASNFDSPLSLLTPQLARLTALGGFRRWDRVVKRFITDPRLHRIFTFQALYAGVPPQRRARGVRRHRLHGHRRRRVLPSRGDAGAARCAGRRGGGRRGRVPLRRNGNRTRAAAATAFGPCTPTPTSASKPTPSSSPPSCPTPIGCSAAPRAACCRCGLRRRRSSRTSAADRRTLRCRTTTSFSATPGSRRSARSSTTAS